jgi:hypothetical protein
MVHIFKFLLFQWTLRNNAGKESDLYIIIVTSKNREHTVESIVRVLVCPLCSAVVILTLKEGEEDEEGAGSLVMFDICLRCYVCNV